MIVHAQTSNVKVRLLFQLVVRILGITFVMLAATPESNTSVQAEEIRERRYIFDETFSWVTPSGREKFLTDVKAAGFNIIVPVVWRGRGVSWPSSLAPRDPVWGAKTTQVDPLNDLIYRAHELGIKVIPWFTIAHRLDNFFPEFHEEGTPDQAFNVHEDRFRRFIVKLMMEVVNRYDIDGINLDYVRTKGVCTTRACRTHYGSHMKRDLIKDAENMWTHQDSGDSIAQWNADAVTRIIEELSMQVRLRRPSLPISIDSHPVAKWTYLEGASSINWANRGLIDLIFDMQYTKEIDMTAVNDTKSKLLDQSKYVLLVGNYEMALTNKQHVWSRDASLVAELLEKSQLHSQMARAAALYEYPYLNNEQIEAIRRGPFRQERSTATPTPDHLFAPSGVVVR